jgi:hypothetical protein
MLTNATDQAAATKLWREKWGVRQCSWEDLNVDEQQAAEKIFRQRQEAIKARLSKAQVQAGSDSVHRAILTWYARASAPLIEQQDALTREARALREEREALEARIGALERRDAA